VTPKLGPAYEPTSCFRDVLDIENAYQTHGHVVLRRAQQLLGDEDAARDVLHEIFTSLLQHPQQFAARSALTTWLYRATTNHCLNLLRNGKTRASLLRRLTATISLRPSGSVCPELPAQLRLALKRMPSRLTSVAIYHHLDGMTREEIAGHMECSVRHVGRLLAELRDWIDREEKSQ